MRYRGYTDDQLQFIRDNAPSMSDVEMGRALGFKSSKVLHIRQRNGIKPMSDRTFWTYPRVKILKDLYLERGQTSATVAKVLGCSDASVRRKAQRMGWGRDPIYRKLNQFTAQAKVSRERKARAPKKPAPPPAPPKMIGASDADLIADFMKRKGVTKVPSGIACGLSQIETQFGAYKPFAGWQEQRMIAHREAEMKRKRSAQRDNLPGDNSPEPSVNLA